ncbi:ATP-dependent DNA helicase, partial [Pseudonocardia sp.]|uniref:ATP-dependent DNA helicase n=1 Tax=Pseudonocardia sp. TaxID=60912 RepID=UPI0031FE1D63
MPTATDLPGVAELLEAAVTAVGGRRREGQDAMAQAVRKAITSGEHVAVQAGTGTGKSLAYLVPAIHHAVAKDATVVISTATIALQRQLVDRDLPRLAKTLKPLLGRAPTFAILKGRRNYLCLNKLHGGDDTDPGDELFDPFAISAMGRQIKRLHEWADTTEKGDRDELVPGVPDSTWRQVSVTARECLGAARCPVGDDCFAEKARAEAGKSDIVVTNHALLAIDALEGRPVLPEHDVVVVDEAHELVDRVTGVATAELTSGMIGATARRLGKLVDQAVADRLAEAGEGLAMVLEDLPSGRWDTLPQAAAGALSAVRDAAASCRQSLGSERREDPEAATGRKIAQASLDEVADTAVRLLAAFDEPDPAKRFDVVWLGEQGPDGARHKVLHVAPLWVGGLLRERLFGRSTVVLTSATLALGGNFDALARQWGLPPEKAADAGGDNDPVPDPDAPKWSGMDVGSPFVHARSGILYVAKRLPPPGRDGLPPSYLDELAGL